MKGRDHFNTDEIAWIRKQLIRLRVAERYEQKGIRAGLRRAGFRISEYATDGSGFTVSDFDALLASGRISTADDVGAKPASTSPTYAGRLSSPGRSVAAGDSVDIWVEQELPSALQALTAPRHTIVAAFGGAVPDLPGLYAIYSSPEIWRQLALGEPPDDRPLYVGKAEHSLVSRDLNTHFATGATGRSSPRRSFAALLAGQLPLIAIPRRPNEPEPDKWTSYALEPDGDKQLTAWMQQHLLLAVWPCPQPVSLGHIERTVLHRWLPPLNLTGVVQPRKRQVRDARKTMAAAAQDWASARGLIKDLQS